MISKFLSDFFILLIKIYKLTISPLLPKSCRFYPSCSQYCSSSIREHGVSKGLWLGFKRIIKCHPFCSGGYDPVVKKASE